MQTPPAHLVGGLASTTLDVTTSMQKLTSVGAGEIFIAARRDNAKQKIFALPDFSDDLKISKIKDFVVVIKSVQKSSKSKLSS